MINKIIFVLLSVFFSLPALAVENDVYDRVIESGKLRCGYVTYSPALVQDPNTLELSGIFYDITEMVGKKLDLKVEWVQESGWGSFIQDLQTDRYDMMCTTAYKKPGRLREADTTMGVYYSGVLTWVRQDDNRLDNDMSVANSPEFTIAGLDGSVTSMIAETDYPKANLVSLPDLSPPSDILLNVATKKADMAFVESYLAYEFLEMNPNTIKPVGTPVRIYPNVMWIKKGQEKFKTMINAALEEIINNGDLDRIFKKYNIHDKSYLKPARPYSY